MINSFIEPFSQVLRNNKNSKSDLGVYLVKKNLISSALILSFLVTFSFAQKKKTKRLTSPDSTKLVTSKKVADKKQDAIKAPFVNKKLANGLEVIVLPDSSIPLVTVEVAVRTGSFTEPLEFNGLSHLFEHLIFKPDRATRIFGCEGYLKRGDRVTYEAANCAEQLKYKKEVGSVDYLNYVDEMGAIRNATTREEVVNYFLTTTSPYLSVAMKRMSNSIRFPVFNKTFLENEKKVVIGEIDRNEDSPGGILQDEIQNRLFYKYPTRKRIAGTRETVNSATIEKLEQIKLRYYVPNNTALIVTGDVDPEKVFKLAEENLGNWEKRKVDPFKDFPLVEHPPLKKSEGLIIKNDRVKSVIIQVGWHGPSIGKDDEATYAADVFSYILSQPDSKFSREMIDSGIAIQSGLGYYTQRNVGPIYLSLTTSPENAKEALAKVYEQIEQFDDPKYFTDQELENSKNQFEARALFDREKLTNYSHTLAFWWSSTGIDYYRDYYKNLRAVSRKDINRYVQTYIKDKPRIGVALLSEDSQKKAELNDNWLIGKIPTVKVIEKKTKK